MARTLPTTDIEHNGEVYTVSFEWAVECNHCDHITRTASDSERISCGNPQCRRKNPRSNIIGKYYDEYLKYGLFTGDEETTTDALAQLTRVKKKLKALKENGWTLDCTTQSSHIAMSKGDIPPLEIHA
jgi:hypothetical protein